MWNSGNMHTLAPRGSNCAPGCVRSTLTRWESTAPFGRPVLPDVKKMTCGSSSPIASSARGRGRPVEPAEAISPHVAIPRRNGARSDTSAWITAAGRAVAMIGASSSSPSAGLSGTNTPPNFATAANSTTVVEVGRGEHRDAVARTQ